MQETHLIYQEISHRLVERLQDIQKPFQSALNLSDDQDATAHLLAQQGISAWDSAAPLPLLVANLPSQLLTHPQETLLDWGRKLQGNGLLLASLLGRESFQELTQAGFKTNLPPLPDVQDVGSLLQQLQFSMPMIDRDFITLAYPSFQDLKHDLEAFGLTLTCVEPKPEIGKTRELPHSVTLEIIYLHAWRPHKTHQKPLAPGSAAVQLSDVL